MLNHTIAQAKSILTWDDSVNNKQALIGIHKQYLDTLSTAFGYFLGNLKLKDSALFDLLYDKFEVLPDKIKTKLLTAPESSYKLHYRLNNTKLLFDFFNTALDAEILKLGQSKTYSRKIWTCTGDYCYTINSENQPVEFKTLTLAGEIPLDFKSPYALGKSVMFEDNGKLFFDESPLIYNNQEMFDVYKKLIGAFEIVYLASDYISDVIKFFTKTLVVRKDPSSDIAFTSASAGQYTGRTLIGNAHLGFVGEDLLSEALVHESIHSILYMLERVQPWVLDKGLYFDETIKIESPWSGRQLRLRPYLQACFVWYGILHYWNIVLKSKLIEDHIPLFYIGTALKGFQNDTNLIDRISALHSKLNPELVNTINELQISVKKDFTC
jgi:hypothetical protein